MTAPLISVVIPTYKGVQRIAAVLQGLQRQTYRQFDVIVVIDGSTDGTDEVVRKHSDGLNLQLIMQPNKGRAGARNTGMARATGRFVVFLDDDVIIDDNILQQYADACSDEYPIVVGKVYPITPRPDEFTRYSTYLHMKWGGHENDGVRQVETSPYITASNCMISRRVFQNLGGFDERLRDAEDFDLAMRAFDNQIPIVLDGRINAGHLLQPDFATYAQRLVEYQQAKNVLLDINPAAAKYIEPLSAMPATKKLLYRAFSGQGWLERIQRGWFRMLPERVRFRVYDFLLTAYFRARA